MIPTDDPKAHVVEMYESGLSLTAIAARLGVSRPAVAGVLQRRGIVIRNHYVLSEEQKVAACERYVAGETITAIAADMGVSQPSLSALLRRRDVEMRPLPTLRHDAFDRQADEAEYWTGFLFADGNVHRRGGGQPSISVGLAYRDRDHLVRFREFLGSSHKICDRAGEHPSSHFSFRSESIAGYLLNSGRYADALSRDLTTSRHFWRGVVDGDGSLCLFRDKARVSLVGRRTVLDAFRVFLFDHGFTNLSVYPHKSIFHLGTTGRPAERIVDLLYDDASVALPRKLERARQIMEYARARQCD